MHTCGADEGACAGHVQDRNSMYVALPNIQGRARADGALLAMWEGLKMLGYVDCYQ